MLLAFALVSGNPLSSSGGDNDVRAGDHCRFVPRQTEILVPEAWVDRRGEPQLRFVKRTVERQVKRCR